MNNTMIVIFVLKLRKHLANWGRTREGTRVGTIGERPVLLSMGQEWGQETEQRGDRRMVLSHRYQSCWKWSWSLDTRRWY